MSEVESASIHDVERMEIWEKWGVGNRCPPWVYDVGDVPNACPYAVDRSNLDLESHEISKHGCMMGDYICIDDQSLAYRACSRGASFTCCPCMMLAVEGCTSLLAGLELTVEPSSGRCYLI